MTPLHLASWGGHAEVIGVLLAKRADGNAKTTEGEEKKSHEGHNSELKISLITRDSKS